MKQKQTNLDDKDLDILNFFPFKSEMSDLGV